MRKLLIFAVCSLLSSLTYAQKVDIYNISDVKAALKSSIENNYKGAFLRFQNDKPLDVAYFQIPEISEFKRFNAAFRHKSPWMMPVIGDDLSELPREVQFLLVERNDGEFLMMIPLVDDKTRSSLSGSKSGGITLIAETGDSLTRISEFLGLYILSGNDPYKMIKMASEDIQAELKSFKLRKDKNTPWIADHFGWCTYNAMSMDELGDAKLSAAMENFRKKEIPLRYVLIDGGWQSATKNGRMNSFDANPEKFPDGIGGTIDMLKNEYDIDRVIIWQALWGTFAGLDKESFPDGIETNAVPVSRMVENAEKLKEKGLYKDLLEDGIYGGPARVFYPGERIWSFVIPDFVPYYDQYFDYLRKKGADGVKVDAIAWVESVGQGRGGRVSAMRNMMTGLQGAANTHFNNELINCSSMSNDYFFNTLSSNLTRSSCDFRPPNPETHGMHIFTNAHTTFWIGEIVLPDWDMFESGQEAGPLHAAGRAISGGPVYSADPPGSENKEVLDRLMTSTGVIPICKDVGRVCLESLFTDPEDNKKAVKIFNTNTAGGVVGAFNCSYDEDIDIIVHEKVKPSDIEGFYQGDFAVYQFSNGNLLRSKPNKSINVKLKEYGFDLFTIVPVSKGFAPIGITGKYNPGGFIKEYNQLSDDLVSLKLLEGGEFIAYSEGKPVEVLVNSRPMDFDYNKNTLKIEVPQKENVLLVIKF